MLGLPSEIDGFAMLLVFSNTHSLVRLPFEKLRDRR